MTLVDAQFIIPIARFSCLRVHLDSLEVSQRQRNAPYLVVITQGQLKVLGDPSQKRGV